MIEIIKHSLGLCGEGHPNILSIIVAGYAAFHVKYAVYYIKNLWSNILLKFKSSKQ